MRCVRRSKARRRHPSACHPQRPCRWSGAEAIPWSPAGRYLTERPSFTLDPAFHAGAYYVQELRRSSLLTCWPGEEVAGKRILDLLRRAGGKTTLYASLAGSDGLVVANEVNRQRAAVLADNVRKWGTGKRGGDGERAGADRGARRMVRHRGGGCPLFRRGNVPQDTRGTGRVEREQCEDMCRPAGGDSARSVEDVASRRIADIQYLHVQTDVENEGSLEGLLAEAGEEIVESTAFDCPPAWGVVCGRVGPFRTSVSIRTGPGARDFLRRWPVRCPMAEAVSVCPSPAERFSRPPDAGSVRNWPVGSPNPSGCALRRWRMSIMRITNRSTRR